MKAVRVVAVLAVLFTFIQIVLGAVVRLTGSGISCPDWPLCYGLWFPTPAKLAALGGIDYSFAQVMFEWTHRFNAAVVVGPLTLALAVLAWRRRRDIAGLWPISIAALKSGSMVDGIWLGTCPARSDARAARELSNCVRIMCLECPERTDTMLAASLSAATDKRRTTLWSIASASVRAPAGLCATSMITLGDSSTVSIRQGHRAAEIPILAVLAAIAANRDDSSSAAASATEAFSAWCRPARGSCISSICHSDPQIGRAHV